MANETTNSNRGVKPIIDEESEAIIFQGASMSQICTIFAMDSRDVKQKLHGAPIKQVGERRGHPIYAIRDVAPYLMKPAWDIDEFVQKMSLADLPVMLRKEYWASMRSRQLFEKEAGDLWPSSKVLDLFAGLFKMIRMRSLLFREMVERETELDTKARSTLVRLIDNYLRDLHAETVSLITKAKSDAQSADLLAEEPADEEEL